MKAQVQAKRYADIARTPKFQDLMARKKKFLLPMSLFFLAYYFTLPILTSYSKVLNQPAFGPVTWAWIFAFSQFIMTWVLCILYSRKSADYDRMIEEIREEHA
ncbi:DUF485 domain-containing protein [Paenibacillus mucilaginosus]|uniref:DUF485 domain-containing protein n=1 Tax=Paenibacillus mucilaginosus (strain KNP414) TaxID=1036673 RepID=F8F759_PAEMK|nr:DUF485 domain-containing protein [Paenibacillus mucilaginosus]AEI45084.1 protein of unknown function DUF485 [Paenibacillus mucilaginosus KNP414]MCG7213015.1 DUF485 domain-containing protein [Paenibacillus mucilaginosus]WDM26578.1 DUF485 domain-containing protein [Paenibacillus mucilaginosus]